MLNHKLEKLLAFVFFLLLAGCSSGDSNVRVTEIGTEPSNTVTETIRLNNCGGKANTEQTAERSHTVSIGGEGQIGIGYQILVASVSAKYAQSKGSSKSQKLVAPPGTNMEFTLAWTEQGWTGTITADGKSGQATYRVRVPISVELMSSRDLGCGIVSLPTTSAPQPTAQPVPPIQQPTQQVADCTTLVSASRPVSPNGTGDNCWLKFYGGATTDITFNDSYPLNNPGNGGRRPPTNLLSGGL